VLDRAFSVTASRAWNGQCAATAVTKNEICLRAMEIGPTKFRPQYIKTIKTP